MLLKQAFALVTMLAATGILAAPNPSEGKGGKGYEDCKGNHGYNIDHKGHEHRDNNNPAYSYNYCSWGHKYDDGDKKCHIEHCPPGKAYWDEEKKCKDKPKCYFGHYWDENECDCKKSHRCDKEPGTKWDDVMQKCRKSYYHDGKKCGKGEEWDDAGKKCEKYAGNCGPYMAWDGESKECVAWGRSFGYGG